MIHFIQIVQDRTIHRFIKYVSGFQGLGRSENGYVVSFWDDENLLKFIVVTVVQLRIY